MTILRVYDTMHQARQECENAYQYAKDKGVRYVSPYRLELEFGNDRYMYVSRNNTDYILGARFDKIEDYTSLGLLPKIMERQRIPFEREYEVKWE